MITTKDLSMQFNNEAAIDYFDGLKDRVLKISNTGLKELADNIGDAQKLAEDALSELKNGNYTYEKKYVEEFGQEDYIYALNKGEELASRMDALYSFFADWLAGWEL